MNRSFPHIDRFPTCLITFFALRRHRRRRRRCCGTSRGKRETIKDSSLTIRHGGMWRAVPRPSQLVSSLVQWQRVGMALCLPARRENISTRNKYFNVMFLLINLPNKYAQKGGEVFFFVVVVVCLRDFTSTRAQDESK